MSDNTLAAVIAERLKIPHAKPSYTANIFGQRFPKLVKKLTAYDGATPDTQRVSSKRTLLR